MNQANLENMPSVSLCFFNRGRKVGEETPTFFIVGGVVAIISAEIS